MANKKNIAPIRVQQNIFSSDLTLNRNSDLGLLE